MYAANPLMILSLSALILAQTSTDPEAVSSAVQVVSQIGDGQPQATATDLGSSGEEPTTTAAPSDLSEESHEGSSTVASHDEESTTVATVTSTAVAQGNSTHPGIQEETENGGYGAYQDAGGAAGLAAIMGALLL